MKDLPVLKKINISNLSDFNNPKFKKDLDSRKNPIIINLTSLPDCDFEKIIYIESRIISMVKSPYFPYPLYFLVPQLGGQQTRIACFLKIEDVPAFFPQRPRNFTKLHQKLVLYNTIAEREFDCLNFEKSDQLISSYVLLNKELTSLYFENKTFDELILLESTNDKKIKKDL